MRLMFVLCAAMLGGACVLAAGPAVAADGFPGALQGAGLPLTWAAPFAGMLISIAVLPLLAPHFWHERHGLVAALWAIAFLVPALLVTGLSATAYVVLHAILFEYLPFIILLFSLYTVAGGVYVEGRLPDTPIANTALLGFGAGLASVVGTTGASIILIRPLIRANEGRASKTHLVVFFIFLVSNIGGSLTPLGDPPLFLGFLRGVDFFWTTTHLLAPTLVSAGALLIAFFVLDSVMARRESANASAPSALSLHGGVNLFLLGAIIAVLIGGATWSPGINITIHGNDVPLQNLAREAALVLIALISLVITPNAARAGNGFTWGPIAEVAKLFIGIFLTIVPVLAMLQAGSQGALAGLIGLVSSPGGAANNAMYFWLSGGLSSFLDNAPTYLVFFDLAGGDAQALMTSGAATLTAISCGAVFMGANSYIANAPNFMVKAIAEDMGVPMPSFFAYCGWAAVFLLPLFGLLTLLFFR